MSEQLGSIPWYAVHVKVYHYDRVEAALRSKGFEVFAPTYSVKRVVAGRERHIAAPLFPGYLFCAFNPHHRLPVVTVPGVIRILGTSNALTPVPIDEIDAIRRAMASGLPLEPYESLLPGEPVEVRNGPLAGIRGEVVYNKGKQRLIIRVSALNDRAVCVEVDQAIIARVPPTRLLAPGGATGTTFRYCEGVS